MPDTIPFGEWMPDQPDRKNAANEAKGVYSKGGHYAPLPAFGEYAGTNGRAAAAVLGARGAYDSSTNGQIFMGTASKLYQMQSRVAVDVSKVGGYAVDETTDWWMMEQFGNYVVAVARAHAPQVFQMGTSSVFANLSGSPPQMTCVARIGDFLMGGKDFTAHWSAFNDITSWTPSATTQAGNQVLDQAQGRIQAIVGGDYAAIFQERAIRRALYVGPPLIWDFGQDAVETRRGAIGPFAVAKFGRSIYFASDDGFYVFDGQASQPIGYGKVDNYFTSRLNYSYRHKVQAAVDTIRKLVVFGFPSGSSTHVDEVLVYSVQDGRWSRDDIDLEVLFDCPVEALTVDNFQLFEPSDNLDSSNLDQYTIDSAVFDDRRRLLAGVADTTHSLGTFTGTSRSATIETGEFEAVPGRRAMVTEVWPVLDVPDSGQVAAAVGYRRALPGATVAYTQASAMNRAGYCPQRIDGRFLRGRLQIAAGASWTKAEGIHVTARVTGGR